MMQEVIASMAFKYSPDGIQVVEVAKGEKIELAADMLVIAESQGWVKFAGKGKKPAVVRDADLGVSDHTDSGAAGDPGVAVEEVASA